VLDEAGLDRDLGRRGGGAQRGLRVAAHHPASGQHVVGPEGVDDGRSRGQRRLDAEHRRQRLPRDRQLLVAHGGHRARLTDERQHGLAAVAHLGRASTGWSFRSG
jgi:hypothetical protein